MGNSRSRVRAAGSPRSRWRARRGRDPQEQEYPGAVQGVNSTRAAPGSPLSVSRTRGSPESTHTSWGSLPSMVGSPPIQPAAKSSSWKLPMAGAAAMRPPGRAGAHSMCEGRGPREGRSEEDSRAPCAAGDAQPSLQSPAPTARPQRTLKAQQAGGHRAPQGRCQGPGDSLSPTFSLANCRTLAP